MCYASYQPVARQSRPEGGGLGAGGDSRIAIAIVLRRIAVVLSLVFGEVNSDLIVLYSHACYCVRLWSVRVFGLASGLWLIFLL